MQNEYPMRINKYLAQRGITTRLGADELVKKKRVFINGMLAVLGSKVNEGDNIEVRGLKQEKKSYKYFAYYKPIEIATHKSTKEEKDVSDTLPKVLRDQGFFPVGRLDKNSHGLLILTNDGRITDRLLGPKYFHEKEYVIKTKNKLRSNFKTKMEQGVNIEGYVTQKCKVRIVNDFMFRIILTEGKKHQIRRMCSALFQEILDLKRERIMNIELGTLKPNNYREIKGEDLREFLRLLDLEKREN